MKGLKVHSSFLNLRFNPDESKWTVEAAGTWTAASFQPAKNGRNPKKANRDAGESSLFFGEILEAAVLRTTENAISLRKSRK